MKKSIFLSVVMIIVLCIALSGCTQTSNVNYVPENRPQNNSAVNNTTNNTNTSVPTNNTSNNTSNTQNNANNTENLPDIWVISRIDNTNNFGTVVNSSVIYDYNEYGDLIQKKETSALEPDKESIVEYNYSYDDKGHMLSQMMSDANGSDEYSYEYDDDLLSHEFRSHTNSKDTLEYTCDTTYSKTGNKSFSIEIRYNENGEAVSRTETSYEYDKQGNLVKEESTTVTSGNHRTITYTYDEKGNVLSRKIEPEDPQNRDADYVYSFGADGRLLRITTTVHDEEDDFITDAIYDYTYYGTKNRESVFTRDVSKTWSVTQFDDLGHEVLKYQASYYGGPAIEGTLSRITWMRLADHLAAKEKAAAAQN